MLRNILRETVFLRLCLAFIIGITLYNYLYQYVNTAIIIKLLLILLLLLIIFYCIINAYNITFKMYNGALVFTIIILFGFQYSYFQDTRNNTTYLSIQYHKSHALIIKDSGKKRKDKCVYEACIYYKNTSIGKVLLTVKEQEIKYKINDLVLVNGLLNAIESKKHPGEFNYKQYLIYKRINHQFVIDSNSIQLLERAKYAGIISISHSFRTKLVSILKTNIKDTSSYEMAAALLLGERADIDKSIMKSYTDTGTIHIISVSGLHVGIIFLVLQYIFKLMPFLKNIVLKTVLIILLIWMYAILTGLPASVIRSALMISFYCIGKAINIKSNPINHVAASALLILSIDTNYLFDVGFQLSYLAVLGIIYIQKPIFDIYIPNNKVLKYIWMMCSVSIAAQLFTLPFCMYYFHQFPNYFLLANLLAIPLSSIALYAAIANLVFAYVPYLNKLSEWVVTYSIQFLNKYLNFIAHLPSAVSVTAPWTLTECILLSLLLFFIFLLFIEKMKRSLKYILMVLILMSINIIIEKNTHQHAHLWVVNGFAKKSYTLETRDSLIHFVPEKTKENQLIRNNILWSNVSLKKQIYVKIPSWNFRLKINAKDYEQTTIDSGLKQGLYEYKCL